MPIFPTHPMNRPLRVAFLGTPEFAAACLDALMASNHKVVGVVTATDKPAGRGHQLQMSEVKKVAITHQLPLLQPPNLKEDEFLESYRAWEADVAVVVAFRMLPESIWSSPPFGTINLHASLLPQFRGAAPIQRSIMAGHIKTGVTTFSLQHKIDTGDILMQASVAIEYDDDAGRLHDRLRDEGKKLIVETLDRLITGDLVSLPQMDGGHDPLLEAPKLFKLDGKIDWKCPVEVIHNHVRGLHPFPKAWTPSPWGDMKILVGHPSQAEIPVESPGTALAHGRQLLIACQDSWYEVKRLTHPGKRPMNSDEWINGLSHMDLGTWND
jgi:methionyl-tRNA formyltransferase